VAADGPSGADLAGADPAGLEKVLGYAFRDLGLLAGAVVHRSAPNERPAACPASNERLEFLGDAVLDLIIAEDLYRRFPEAPEGELTRYKASLVSELALADVARDVGLGSYLLLGRGEEETGGRDKPSILSDALEAVLGAVYLDGGVAAAEALVLRLFGDALAAVQETGAPRGDYKTALQEWTQARGLGLPAYRLEATEGPDHARRYTVVVALGGKALATGQGASKREAERLAARGALAALGVIEEPGAGADSGS
jgi:ribonuclease III